MNALVPPRNTSNPAPAINPSSNAFTNAASSTTAPRAVLIKYGGTFHHLELRRGDDVACVFVQWEV